MKSNIFLPKTIRVGYTNRTDTYTGKLAYVIYIDAKGKVRKEASWQSWRDKKIEPTDFSNEPTSGFVLNKKVGGHSSGWNHRQTYARVYDPRGFEFEITVPNLLYILENTSAIKGKGLEGEFVYGWDGTDLLLLPTSAPEYAELVKFADATYNKESITPKNIILGATYKTKKNEEWIYLGKYIEYATVNGYYGAKPTGSAVGNKYWFKTEEGIQTVANIKDKLIQVIDEKPVANYAELMDEIEGMERYSPYNPHADKIINVSLETLREITETRDETNNRRYGTYAYYINPEVIFTYEGINILANLVGKRERTKDDKFGRIPDGYYIYNLKRQIPIEDSEYEYKGRETNYYYHSYETGWEFSYADNKYRRDAKLAQIAKKLKPYTEKYRGEDALLSLEKIYTDLNLKLRQKYLMNGKPLLMQYDSLIDYEYVDLEDYEDETEENLETMEATNG